MDFSPQQMILAGAGIAAGALLATLFYLASQLRRERSQRKHLARELLALQRAYAQLQAQGREREQQHRAQVGLLDEHRNALKQEFENLANRIFEHRSAQFDTHSRESLEQLLRPFREQIQGFQARVEQVHTESIRGQTGLTGELRKVLEIGLEMNQQAGKLSAALRGDNKIAGNWGEAQLERSLQLAGLRSGEHYRAQAVLRDDGGNRHLPDFIVDLPDGKHLVIDSKVSLLDYERAINAQDDGQQKAALAAHARSVRAHVDELARKDYTRLPQLDSPDFVLMFMPVEPAYIEAMRQDRELYNHAFGKGVVLVSHTTLIPILRTVANLWMADASHREAREISARAGEVYNQVGLVAERLQKLGNTLSTVGNHYNDTVRALAGKQGLHGKVERFRQLSSGATRTPPELNALHTDLERERLQSILDESETDST